jgi:hypothetical protein
MQNTDRYLLLSNKEDFAALGVNSPKEKQEQLEAFGKKLPESRSLSHLQTRINKALFESSWTL